MVTENPYLPHLLKDVVSKVSDVMEAKVDPFLVKWKHGLVQDVFKSVYKENNTDPLVWLVMPFETLRGRKIDLYGDSSCELLIVMPTKPEWTMEEREDNIFGPYLFPIYYEFLNQLSIHRTNSKKTFIIEAKGVEHTERVIPYWGGDETGNNNTQNFSKDFVDAIQIKNLKLTVNKNC